MTARCWSGSGPRFDVAWADRPWTLRLDADRPGLYSGSSGPLLGLEGLAADGRRDLTAFSAANRTEFGCRFARVEATYAPPGWGEMTVRATWVLSGEPEAVDLLVELSARSVGNLKDVEVITLSQLDPVSEQPGPGTSRGRIVWPRDTHSAGLSFDGREPDAEGLDTRPPGLLGELPPWVVHAADLEGWSYIDMAHPDDVSRRVVDEAAPSIRHALFGYDLERGVVLRGRLRGLWSREPDAAGHGVQVLTRFLAEPLPLTT